MAVSVAGAVDGDLRSFGVPPRLRALKIFFHFVRQSFDALKASLAFHCSCSDRIEKIVLLFY